MRNSHANLLETHLPLISPMTHWAKEGSDVELRTGYWDTYYSNDQLIRKQPPSQFAAFVASECGDFPLVVDVGCGNGRDTLFFAQLGHSTLGIDKSSAAIDQSTRKILGYDEQIEAHSFLCMNAMALPDAKDLIDRIAKIKKVIYSRFFLHAITEEEQTAFLDFATASMQTGDMLALEFRTLQDQNREKVTGAHYRRYIDADQLSHQITHEHGFALSYFAEGIGFAKFRSDDAFVARALFLKD